MVRRACMPWRKGARAPRGWQAAVLVKRMVRPGKEGPIEKVTFEQDLKLLRE